MFSSITCKSFTSKLLTDEGYLLCFHLGEMLLIAYKHFLKLNDTEVQIPKEFINTNYDGAL